MELIFKDSPSPSSAPSTPTERPLIASTPSKPQLDVLDVLGSGEDPRHQLWSTSFLDQQFWLYLYGLVMSACAQLVMNRGSMGAEQAVRDVLSE